MRALAAGVIDAPAEGTDATERDWTEAPLSELVHHIVATYHVPLRDELPRLEALARTAVQMHGPKAPWLAQVEDLVGELSAELNEHIQKEERVLFPAIRAIEQSDYRNPVWIAGPITVMEQEHERANALLAELRRLTSSYAVPEWACQTVEALYQGLVALESSMDEHVGLENDVLFPRALERAGA